MARLGYLLLDDDPLMIEMLEPKLKRLDLAGIEGVRAFHRPEHVLEHLENAGGPVVLISDYNLKASMNGLDVLGHVARDHPDTIRILVSGYTREQIGIPDDAPLHGFVEKALMADDIVRDIVAIIERVRADPGSRADDGPTTTPRDEPPQETEVPPPAPAPAVEMPSAADAPKADIFHTFIANTADFAIFALDPLGIVTTWNPGAERIKGWTEKEILGRHFSAFYPPGDAAAHKPEYVLQRAIDDGRFEDEGWRMRKDGTMFWANAVITAVRDRHGGLMGFVKVTRDMTTRRHAEDAMRQSEERYRLFIESVKDYAMFILDTAGYVMTWNEGAQRLKGYNAKEIVGKHFSTFYTAPDRERQHPQDELTIALRDGRYEEEGWRLRKDGSRFWASVTITALFDTDGRHVGFAKVTRDLTERKRAEQDLRSRADSFAELNRELDAFSHSVAHDLRAPVRAMHNIILNVLETAGERLDEDEKRALHVAVSSSKNMGELIHSLLELSKAARQEPQRSVFDLSQLVHDVLDEKRLVFPDHTIDARIQPGLQANADPRLVRVAVANLLDNAIKFAKDHDARLAFGREDAEKGGAYYVRDEGVGFPQEEAGLLFRPFSRLDSSGGVAGTGIGLTIVERIIRRHGGNIWVESEPDRGTIFRFTLDDAATS